MTVPSVFASAAERAGSRLTVGTTEMFLQKPREGYIVKKIQNAVGNSLACSAFCKAANVHRLTEKRSISLPERSRPFPTAFFENRRRGMP